jgi:hypothetical protein
MSLDRNGTIVWDLSQIPKRATGMSVLQQNPEPLRAMPQAKITGANRAKFSAESQLARAAGPIAFSAGRGAVGVPGARGVWQLLDRGEVACVIEASGATPNVSGPYPLIGGRCTGRTVS